MKKKRIFIFSVGRSDYDRYFPIINQLHNSNKSLLTTVKISLFMLGILTGQ